MMHSTQPSRGGLSIAKVVRELYREGQEDYYLEPIVLVDREDLPIGLIQNGDSVIFCCRRGEREIQLTEAFTSPEFEHFPRPDLDQLTFAILTLYHDKFRNLPIAFRPNRHPSTLGEVVSGAGLKQLRVAESEKFAHVTIFLNGGENQPFSGEEDVCIPSPKGVPFDQVPGLSLPEVAQSVIQGIESHYDLIVTNFANGDVIGHTKNEQAKLECAKIVDQQLGRVIEAALAEDYVVMVTADHGNLEIMRHPDSSPHVAHTTNLVPFILLDPSALSPVSLRNGKLADIAPTVLDVLGLDQPEEMTGSSLIQGSGGNQPRQVLLVILDGWGLGEQNDANPIYLAETPVFDDLLASYPNSKLQASQEAVGLKAGKAGNSEAGHSNIGAGRIILQDDVRIDHALADGSFSTNQELVKVIEKARGSGNNLHLIALLTEKSSHGSIDYPLALLRMAKQRGLDQVFLHLIFDGRSTEPGSAPDLLENFDRQVLEVGIGEVVSGVGRGIALDRDKNYAKTRQAFDAFVSGIGIKATLC